jgi:peptidoglycan/LPS O-acetylase OafA/YrhL
MEQNNRIKILDGFRTIAIFSVILFHYYSRWTMPYEIFNLYPYGNKYDHFGYGYLGVQFFFMISGFVIAFTLYKTGSIKDFWKKRIARLFPAMLLCSLITLLVLRCLDNSSLFPDGHSIRNFLCSLTFIAPSLLNYCFRSLHGNYLNGSYWSLWPEIQFYIMASVLYYFNPSKFIRNFSVLAFVLCAMNWFVGTLHTGVFFTAKYDFWFGEIFNLPQYIGWFMAGILFYTIYSKKTERITISLSAAVIVLQLCQCMQWELLIMLVFIGLFVVFLLSPKALHFLAYKPIAAVGMASYSLYLIHESIGVLLIHKYGGYFGRFDWLFTILLITAMILFSLLCYRLVERPVGRWIHKKK